jgi:hypothetical protein
VESNPVVGNGYQMLGDVLDKNRQQVKRVLPGWLAKPELVSVDLSDQQMPVQNMEGKECSSLFYFCFLQGSRHSRSTLRVNAEGH